MNKHGLFENDIHKITIHLSAEIMFVERGRGHLLHTAVTLTTLRASWLIASRLKSENDIPPDWPIAEHAKTGGTQNRHQVEQRKWIYEKSKREYYSI